MDRTGISAVKRELRKSIIERRDALSADLRMEMSGVITAKLTELEACGRAEIVLAYMSFGSEFDTTGFARHVMESGKALALPKLRKDRSGLDLYVVSSLEDGLEPGLWGIREPRDGMMIEDFSLIDFVLVPGVAFTRTGGRLGYGGGFYDRLLVGKRRDALAVAAAFSVQIVEEVPIEENDIFMDGVVTEKGEHFRIREDR